MMNCGEVIVCLIVMLVLGGRLLVVDSWVGWFVGGWVSSMEVGNVSIVISVVMIVIIICQLQFLVSCVVRGDMVIGVRFMFVEMSEMVKVCCVLNQFVIVVIIGVKKVDIVLLVMRLNVSWKMRREGVCVVVQRFVVKRIVFEVMIGWVLKWLERVFQIIVVVVMERKLMVMVVEMLV